MPDILFILLLALIIFGPKKLPEVMRTVAKYMAQFRMMSEDLKRLEERQKKIAAPASPADAPQIVSTPAPAESQNLPPSPVA